MTLHVQLIKISAIAVLAALPFCESASAQGSRSSRPTTLAEIGCSTYRNGTNNSYHHRQGYYASNVDITLGREVWRSIALLGSPGNSNLVEFVGVSCRLAEPTEAPEFNTLYLAFGMPQSRSNKNCRSLDFSVYIDGNLYGTETLRMGDPGVRWPIDISGARSVAFEAVVTPLSDRSVLRPACTPLHFFEDIIE